MQAWKVVLPVERFIPAWFQMVPCDNMASALQVCKVADRRLGGPCVPATYHLLG